MTANEKKLWLGVAVIIPLTLIGQYLSGLSAPNLSSNAGSHYDLGAAQHLLESEANIRTRHQAVLQRLETLESKFPAAGNYDQTAIDLLKMSESAAASCGLTIQTKSALQIADQVIGVTLEGQTTAVSLFKFLYETTNGRYGLKIKRLQIHSLPEQGLLSYTIVLAIPLIAKEERMP
jgi:hypothetical protein